MSLHFYLTIGAILFVLGLLTMLTKKNAVAVLMGVELVLNSANINFVAFSRFSGAGGLAGESARIGFESGRVEGQVMGIFVIILAAAEAAVAMAIVLNLYRQHKAIDIDAVSQLRG